MSSKKHTFAICAYKESPYLEECIQSLLNQTVKSEIYLATSTPCDYIKDMCAKYGIPMYVNEGEAGITQDWNFAYSKCTTPIVTIAHQDDVYFKNYTESILSMSENVERPLIYFSDYGELRNGNIEYNIKNLKIKRIMLFPLKGKLFRNNIFVRRRILSLGDPICCPAVAFFRENLPDVVFNNHFRTNEDWEAWEMISKLKGAFLYSKEPRMAHRIHEDSETSATIRETGRSAEDLEMYRKFWPEWIAKVLVGFYKNSEKSNDL